jgi:hypothetical protein
MPLVGFEHTILVSERTKTHALDRTATGIGQKTFTEIIRLEFGNYCRLTYINNSRG